VINLKAENIPQELTTYNQFVNWKAVKKDNGKIDKKPLNPRTGFNAKSNDPGTWGSYTEATARYLKYKGNGVSGIGFEFSANDHFCGVDLDDCRNPETGEAAPWAEKILRDFNSYAEVSPSGTGIKIFCKGRLPHGAVKTRHVEMYDQGRFFTLTGHVWGNYTTINESQEAIDRLYKKVKPEKKESAVKTGSTPSSQDDNQIVDIAIGTKNGDKVLALLNGNWDGYSSQSEADLALCNHLAFYCGDNPEQIDRLFRTSGLMRDKWDKKHHSDGRTYGQGTIEKAISGTTEVYKPPAETTHVSGAKALQLEGYGDTEKKPGKPKASLLGLEDLRPLFDEKVEWLYRNHIPKGMPIILNGREGEGKTTIAVQIGNEILYQNPEGIIIWIASEGFVSDTKDKMDKLGVDESRFKILRNADDTFRWNFVIQQDIKAIHILMDEVSKAIPILAVIVDSIRGITPYDDLDSRIKNPMMALNGIICDKFRASLIYIHHLKKGGKDGMLLDRNTGPTSIASSVRAVYTVLPVSSSVKKIVKAKTNILGHEPIELFSAKSGNGIVIYESKEKSDSSLIGQAQEWLVEIFRKQTDHLVSDIYQDGATLGFSSDVLKKAKKHLPVDASNDGVGKPWHWKCESFLDSENTALSGKTEKMTFEKPNNISEGDESAERDGYTSKNPREGRGRRECREGNENKNYPSHKSNKNIKDLYTPPVEDSSSISMFFNENQKTADEPLEETEL